MLPSRLLQCTVGATVMIVLFAGCRASTPVSESPSPVSASPAPVPAPTSEPPTSAPTAPPPTPTLQSSPKAGHWEGTNPSVSFDVTGDGQIRNLTISVSLSVGQTCAPKIEQIDVESDGKFVWTLTIEKDAAFATTEAQLLKIFQAPTPEVTKTASGDMVDVTRISGNFDSPTTSSGMYRIVTCEEMLLLPANEGKWTAEWKSA